MVITRVKLVDLVVEPEDISDVSEFNIFRFRAKGVFDDKPVYYYSHEKVEGLKRRVDNEQVYLITRLRYE